MIRAPQGDKKYWDTRVSRDINWLEKAKGILKDSAKNPAYMPQFSFDLSHDILSAILNRYSRGDEVAELAQYFPQLLNVWELSNKWAAEACTRLSVNKCRDWTFDLSDLNHYNFCFWLVGLALLLDIPDDQWQRLLALIGGEGEDVLLNRLIATRQPNRKIGETVLHRKPYARLLKAIDVAKIDQPQQLKNFVDRWYEELARKGRNELWWYTYGDPVKHPLEMGGYFGRWCIEAAVVAKAFKIDDSLCLGHEHYPGDLPRPNGPSTHPAKAEPSRSWFWRLLGRP